MTTQLLTARQAAERLTVSRTILYRLVRRGALDVVQVESLMRVPTTSIDAYVRRLIEQAVALGGDR